MPTSCLKRKVSKSFICISLTMPCSRLALSLIEIEKMIRFTRKPCVSISQEYYIFTSNTQYPKRFSRFLYSYACRFTPVSITGKRYNHISAILCNNVN